MIKPSKNCYAGQALHWGRLPLDIVDRRPRGHVWVQRWGPVYPGHSRTPHFVRCDGSCKIYVSWTEQLSIVNNGMWPTSRSLRQPLKNKPNKLPVTVLFMHRAIWVGAQP